MSSTPPAGWYPDPVTGSGHRWWDGQAWTAATHPPAAPAVAQPAVAMAGAATAGSSEPWSYYGGRSAGSPLTQSQPGFGTPPIVAARSQSGNRFALITFGIVAFYIFVALNTHIVFFGILPLAMSLRSKRVGEPLAWPAIGAAVLSIVFAASVLMHH